MTKQQYPIVLAIKHKDEKVRMDSRSGGVFTAISDYFFEHGGVVYGCKLDNNLNAIHTRVDSKEQRDYLRGSKYVQSNIGKGFQDVKDDLENEKLVLFSGTSCQITGLKAYLGKEYHNLISLDIVCHGVPSPKVWKDYINYVEEINNMYCVKADFRNKKDFGWKDHVETLFLSDNDNNEKKIDSRVYTSLFYSHNTLRPSCFSFPYKNVLHPGDITIGDYWGIEKIDESFNDSDKGVSLVLINNERGVNIIDCCLDQVVYRKCRIEDSMQTPLIKPFECPPNRKRFWKYYNTHTFSSVVKKYGGIGIWSRTKKKIKRICLKLKTSSNY